MLKSPMQQRIEWRRKRKFEEFFDDGQVPLPHPHHQQALHYLSNTNRLVSIINGVTLLFSNKKFWCLLVVSVVSVVCHFIANWLTPAHPYVAMVNSLQCAWYHGLNDSEAARFLGFPYALPPRPIPEDEDQLIGLPTHLLRRWSAPVPIDDQEKCILSHRSRDCSLVGGVHHCYLLAHPEFCAHYRLFKYQKQSRMRIVPDEADANADNITKAFAAIQNKTTLQEPEEDLSVSEDCLYLTISRPKDYLAAAYPIIVFVTGSGFVAETTWSAGQDSPIHPDKDLADSLQAVVVRINYRLGFYGTFFDENMKMRNFGLEDIIQGLRYLHEVGKYFGGDSSRIVLVGHGSGAAHAMALLTYQRESGSRLVHAVWLSSGPSRIPRNFNKMEKQLRDEICDVSISMGEEDLKACRDKLMAMEETDLMNLFNSNKMLLKEWSHTGYLMTINESFRTKTKPENTVPFNVEWLAPDNVVFSQSPTEGSGFSSWDDVPVVFANVDSHFEAFPGFGHKDGWTLNWNSIINDFYKMGYSAKPEALLKDLAKVTAGVSDPHSLLVGVRIATWLKQVCPYRYLAKSLTRTVRKSPVYHYVMHFALKYPARFIHLRDRRKLNGAFYGLDLLFMLGTAPQVVDEWDRKDDAFMHHMRDTLRQFTHKLTLPSSWKPMGANGFYTVFGETSGEFKSVNVTDRMSFCDSIPFEHEEKFRTHI